jgi:hypothetical protein
VEVRPARSVSPAGVPIQLRAENFDHRGRINRRALAPWHLHAGSTTRQIGAMLLMIGVGRHISNNDLIAARTIALRDHLAGANPPE